MSIIKKWNGLELHTKILIGLILGIIVGVIFGPKTDLIEPIGQLFIRLIRMVIIPLVFSSLIVGAASVGDPKSLGRIGSKTIAFYLCTTAFAVIIGLVLGNVIQPGIGLSLDVGNVSMEAKEAPPLSQTLINIVPKNPIVALQQGNMLQIIVFALFIGVSISLVGKKGEPVLNFFDSFAEIMYKLTALVMEFAPFGILALIASVVGSFGLSVLLPLLKVIIAVYLGCLIHWLITYGGAIKFFSRLSLVKFFKGIASAQIFAFSTCSSSGTLPVTTKCCRDNLGVSDKISSFVLPLGATINMDGTALYQGVCALFVAQVYGIDLNIAQQFTVVLTATLASIGTAGVPSAGLIMLTLTLKSVGLPLEGVALIAGIDRILDMARTVTNITGDSAATVIVASSEGEIDLDVANAETVSA
ncbi:dicarboxylate/amino acid:cation symporter [Orenia marismortui]|uniref:Na+/H+-dicarboxylate symporter n=1 Tax=Orenia marismortui TaxID=46469 RepID=A0A4R8H7S3_9FIRM|nr:dicarboxylate/amino acid:cation symporter [Orenia marismortui]TDX51608.1 Na+/H+-dicarboxylate symporter [Orenia marismortui]